MAYVADLLTQKKSSRVYTISPSATVLAATRLMNRHKIGALVVVLNGEENSNESGGESTARCEKVVGMFTERDVLTRLVVEQRDPAGTLVEEIMTPNVAFCRSDTTVDEVSAMMRERHIRHLPVCDSGSELRGLISIGDLNAWHAQGQEVTIQYLHEYIHGRA